MLVRGGVNGWEMVETNDDGDFDVVLVVECVDEDVVDMKILVDVVVARGVVVVAVDFSGVEVEGGLDVGLGVVVEVIFSFSSEYVAKLRILTNSVIS